MGFPFRLFKKKLNINYYFPCNVISYSKKNSSSRFNCLNQNTKFFKNSKCIHISTYDSYALLTFHGYFESLIKTICAHMHLALDLANIINQKHEFARRQSRIRLWVHIHTRFNTIDIPGTRKEISFSLSLTYCKFG